MANEVTKDALDAIEAKFKEMSKEFAKDADYKAQLTELKDEFKSLKTEIKAEMKAEKDAENVDLDAKFKRLEDIQASQGDIMNSWESHKATDAASKSIYEQVSELFTKNTDSYNKFVEKKEPFKMELKAAGTMTVGVNITGSTTLLPTPVMTPGYNPARRNPPTFIEYVPISRTSSARVAYVDQVNIDGTSATTAEGAAKPAIDADFKVSYSSAIKIAATTKISDEMLQDIDFMSKAVSDELISRVKLAASGNIYTYITSGMTPGYTEVNAAYLDVFSLARQATLYDIILAGAATINAGNHQATHVFVNPLQYAWLGWAKTTTGQYTQPEMNDLLGLQLAGLTVVPTNAVATGKYIVCDITKLNVLMYQDLMVEAGWENDDFTKNLRTFRGEMRVHYYVKDNDKTAFLYGDIATSVLYMTNTV